MFVLYNSVWDLSLDFISDENNAHENCVLFTYRKDVLFSAYNYMNKSAVQTKTLQQLFSSMD